MSIAVPAKLSRTHVVFVFVGVLLGMLLTGEGIAHAVEVGNDEIVFEKVRYDFPNAGQSTWYWTVISGDQPAISHVTFEVNLDLVNIDDEGTWTDFDTLNSGDGDPVIGTDPQTGDLTGIKFDEAFSGGESRGYYITVDDNYATDTITFASKAGNDFDSVDMTGPSLSGELENGDGDGDDGTLSAQKDVELFEDRVGNGKPNPGDLLEYTVTVTNDADEAVDNVALDDTVDASIALICADPDPTTTQGSIEACSEGPEETLEVAIGTIDANDSVLVTYKVEVLRGSARKASNQVVVTGDTSGGEEIEVSKETETEISDPSGFFYDEETGRIIEGVEISVEGPDGANITIADDGSDGSYQWWFDGDGGVFEMSLDLPPGYALSEECQPGDAPPFNPDPDDPDPITLGNDEDPDNPGFLTSSECTDYFFTFELESGDPFIESNNFPLRPVGGATVGGDPPLWGDTLLFPTPETFLGRDLNHDGDTDDAVLRIKNVRTGQIENTGIPISNRHRAVDLYRDTAVFVTQESSLRNGGGLFNLWGTLRSDEGPIGVLDVETGEVEMLDVWGARPTVHDDIVTISGSRVRYYDLSRDRLVDTGLAGTRPAVWGEWIVYERSIDDVPTLQLYHLPTGETQNTGIAGAYPAIHEGTVAFTTEEAWVGRDLNGDGDRSDTVVRAYDVAEDRVINTGQAGADPAIYGDRIAFSQGRSILYHDLSNGRTYATGEQGAEPDIYQDTVTSYVWEGWIGTDLSADRDQDDPIVQTHTVSEADRVLPQPHLMASPHPQPDPLALTQVFSHRQANGVRVGVQGQGIERVELSVYDLSGQRVAERSATGTQLTWRLNTDDGRRVANGVYLYAVTARGADGQLERSEVRKLVVLR